MSSADWYARRLTQGQQPVYTPQPAPPNLPNPQPQPQGYQQPHHVIPPSAQPEPPPLDTPQARAQAVGNDKAAALLSIRADDVQGLALKQHARGVCPSCGSPHYMPRGPSKVTQHGMVEPMSVCFSCGYPNKQGPN